MPPLVETVAVKLGIDSYGALPISPARSRAMIRAGAERAMRLIGPIPPSVMGRRTAW